MALIIPGWNPAPFQGDLAPASLTAITCPASGSSTASATVAWPAVVAGDMAVLFDATGGYYSPPALVTPSGFTNIANQTGSIFRFATHYKRCDGTETGNITGMTPVLGGDKGIFILRGDFAFATVTGAGGQNGTYSTGNPGAITVAASGGTPPTVVIGLYYAQTGSIDPRTFSTTKDGEQSLVSGRMYLAWKLYTSAPANSNIDMDDEGDGNINQGFYANLTI